MEPMSLRWCLPALVVLAFAAGCAEPPNKEMDQAQGAIDAARAAGAEQYAADEYNGAVAALRQSTEAVAQNDYRLALNHALDSRERAQNAARRTADMKAQVRAEVERALLEVSGLIVQINAGVEGARRNRVARKLLTGPAQTAAAASEEVQKARAQIEAGDYLGARSALNDVKSRLGKAIAALEEATAPASSRRRR
jgi:hypothetical protein